MSIRSRIVGSIAPLTLVGGTSAAVAVEPVNAATTACGAGCTGLSVQKWGSGYVSAVALGIARVGQAVVLSPAGPSSWEDFRLLYESTVATFSNACTVRPSL